LDDKKIIKHDIIIDCIIYKNYLPFSVILFIDGFSK
jgi:hypothetical protein